MSKLRLVLALASSAVIFVGCSDAKNVAESQAGVVPQAKQPSAAAAFVASDWQNQLIKNCSSSPSGSANSKAMIDLAALAKLTDGQNGLTLSDGSIVYFGTPESVSTTPTEIPEREAMSMYYDGSFCHVFAGGKEVYKTRMIEKLFIAAVVPKAVPQIEGVWPVKVESLPSVKDSAKSAYTQELSVVDTSPIFLLVNQALKPTSLTHELLAEKLNISLPTAREFFPLEKPLDLYHSARLTGEQEQMWFDQNHPNLIAPTWVLGPLFSGNIQTLEVNLSFRTLRLANDSPLAFTARFHLLDHGLRRENFMFRLTSLNVLTEAKFDPIHACGAERLQILRELTPAVPTRVDPGYKETLTPCLGLGASRIEDILEANKQLVPIALAGVSADQGIDYQGWDVALRAVAVQLMLQGKNVAAELDPQGRSPYIQKVSSNLDSLTTTAKRWQIRQNGTRGLELEQDLGRLLIPVADR